MVKKNRPPKPKTVALTIKTIHGSGILSFQKTREETSKKPSIGRAKGKSHIHPGTGTGGEARLSSPWRRTVKVGWALVNRRRHRNVREKDVAKVKHPMGVLRIGYNNTRRGWGGNPVGTQAFKPKLIGKRGGPWVLVHRRGPGSHFNKQRLRPGISVLDGASKNRI